MRYSRPISTMTLAVLDVIAITGRITGREIAWSLGLDNADVNKILNNLRSRGYATCSSVAHRVLDASWSPTARRPTGHQTPVDRRRTTDLAAYDAFQRAIEEQRLANERRKVELRERQQAQTSAKQRLDSVFDSSGDDGGEIPVSGPSRYVSPHVLTGRGPIRRPGSTDFLQVPSRTVFRDGSGGI